MIVRDETFHLTETRTTPDSCESDLELSADEMCFWHSGELKATYSEAHEQCRQKGMILGGFFSACTYEKVPLLGV